MGHPEEGGCAMRAMVILLAMLGLSPLPGGDVEKLLPDAEKVEKTGRTLSPESRAKIEKALGEPLPAGAPEIWEARATIPSVSVAEKTRVRVTVVEVRGAKGTMKIGVAAIPEDRMVAAVGLLKNEDDPALGKGGFLESMQGFVYGEALFSPPSVLVEARKQAEKSPDGETAMLLGFRRGMYDVGAAWTAMSELPQNKVRATKAAALAKELDPLIRMTRKVPFLKQAPQERFTRWMSEFREGLHSISRDAAAEKTEEVQRTIHQLETNVCSKCHGSSRRPFRERRTELGIGDGYFEPGLDVAPASPEMETSYRALLRGVRRAVLILSEAK